MIPQKVIFDYKRNIRLPKRVWAVGLLCLSLVQAKAFGTKLDSLFSQMINAQNDSTKVSLLNKIAFGLSAQRPDTALKYVNQAIEISEKDGLKKGKADAYHVKGILMSNMGMVDAAISNYAVALKLRKKIGDKKGVSATLTNLGTVYLKENKIDSAVFWYKSSLKVDEELHDTIGTATDFNNIGFSFWQAKKFDSARYYFKSALKYYSDIAYLNKMGSTMSNIGGTYFYQNKLDTALMCFRSAYEDYKSVKSYDGMAVALGNKAQILERMGKLKQAALQRKGAVFLWKRLKKPSSLAQAYLDLGKNFELQKQWNLALKSTNLALTISDSVSIPVLKMQIASELSQIYDSLKNSNQSDYYSTLYKYLKDSLQQVQSQSDSNQLNLRKDFAKKIISVNQNKRIFNKYKLISIIELIIVLLLLAALVVFYLKWRKKREE